jgi:hypothetical protein
VLFFTKKPLMNRNRKICEAMSTGKARLRSQLGQLTQADLLAVEEAIKVHLALPR